MTERRPSEVLGSLPRTRPHRRSDKRAARTPAAPGEPQAAVTGEARSSGSGVSPKRPAGRPPERAAPAAKTAQGRPAAAKGAELAGTAVQAAAELAEIGISIGARALRRAVSRLPRP
ncbi:MAG: hypothetical protein ACYC91_04640 [Solirubrobacteraceae bacterium]